MAKLKPDPVHSSDFLEYLAGYSDFSFELTVLKLLRTAGLSCEHGGLYEDPATSKSREFDIRAVRTNGRFRVRLAVECKNIRENFPVLISCVPRHDSESYQDMAMVSDPSSNSLGAGLAIYSSRAKILRIDRAHSLYRPGEPVGKSTAQVGRTLDGSISSNDSEIYEKWGQCLSSSQELADRMYWDGDGEPGNPLYMCAVLPFVVVPDGRLWAVEYDYDGNRTTEPKPVNRCSCYVGKSYRIGTKMAGATVAISHIEVTTTTGLTEFVAAHLPGEGSMEALFPKLGMQAAFNRSTE